mgnify:CR=1 FL=1
MSVQWRCFIAGGRAVAPVSAEGGRAGGGDRVRLRNGWALMVGVGLVTVCCVLHD